MNKSELIAAVADATGASKAAVTRTVDAVIETAGAALKRGETIRINGFIKLEPKVRAAHVGRNPITGGPVQVPEKTTVKAKAYDSLLGDSEGGEL